MNVITIAEIKRGGMAALDAALNRPHQGGSVTIMKRNRTAAIVLTLEAYEALLAKAAEADKSKPTLSALDWLLEQQPINTPGLNIDEIAQRLNDIRAEWS
jgi:PHD/YefM family antitoxin component YafN of YafNO toxin-antitoxin module